MKNKLVLLLLMCLAINSRASEHYSHVSLNFFSDSDRVLLLGNSITLHLPDRSIGWNGNWGMAASSADKDYVHILINRVTQLNKNAIVKYANISGEFEKNFPNIDTTALAKYKLFKPTIIIIKLGENITDQQKIKNYLGQKLFELVNILKTDNLKSVCIAGPFWENDAANEEIKKICQAQNWKYIDLSQLSANKDNEALKLFSNPGVARHPSDQGMQAIADLLWEYLSQALR